MAKPVLEIDGERFDDEGGFYEEVSRQLIPGAAWGRNLDAFNDILCGGFGTPHEGFVLRWRNSERSRRLLGERVPEEPPWRGHTLFDELVEIIRDHGPAGRLPECGVDLELC